LKTNRGAKMKRFGGFFCYFVLFCVAVSFSLNKRQENLIAKDLGQSFISCVESDFDSNKNSAKSGILSRCDWCLLVESTSVDRLMIRRRCVNNSFVLAIFGRVEGNVICEHGKWSNIDSIYCACRNEDLCNQKQLDELQKVST
ncbi:hypothetical protein T03_12564, partial [Trichinella britovi]